MSMPSMRARGLAALLALSLCLLGAGSAVAFDLLDALDFADQARARARNAQADNAEVHDVAPPGVMMSDLGGVSRTRACLRGADCSRPAVTAGNYYHATTRAPWVIYQSYLGSLSRRGRLHEAGEIAAHNVVDVPEAAIRPGGLHVRSFSVGTSSMRLR